VPFYFGGTSLLIIVVVTMDFMAQVQAYIMTHQYESLLRKANYDIAFDFQGLMKSAVLARSSGAARVVGFSM